MAYATPHDTPTFVTYAGGTYSVTSVTVNYAEDAVIDVSHLGLAKDSYFKTQKAPLKGGPDGSTGIEVSFDYLGKTSIAPGGSGTFVVTGLISGGTATCSASNVNAVMNDIYRGSATFRVEV